MAKVVGNFAYVTQSIELQSRRRQRVHYARRVIVARGICGTKSAGERQGFRSLCERPGPGGFGWPAVCHRVGGNHFREFENRWSDCRRRTITVRTIARATSVDRDAYTLCPG